MKKSNVPQTKKNYAIVGAVLFCVILLPILFFQLSGNPDEVESTVDSNKITNNINNIHPPVSLNPGSPVSVLSSDELFDRIHKRSQLKEDLIINDELLKKLSAKCDALSQHAQVNLQIYFLSLKIIIINQSTC